jgi:DNA-binding GntR family transcriptional regulator
MILGTPLKQQSLQKLVYQTIRQAILEREIEPGEQINIRKLAEKLSVSTMPVREALRQLEAEGMVNFNSNKRIVASQLSRSELHDIYNIRIPLEEMALLKCFERKDETGLRHLEELQRQMSKPDITGVEWFNLNRAFHMKLHKMSGSSRLYNILQGLWNSTGPYLRIYSEDKKNVIKGNQEHELILKGLRNSDSNIAKKTLRKHLGNGLKAIELNIKSQLKDSD